MKKNDWVQIETTVLPADRRAPGLPPETADKPYIMRVNGLLEEDTPAGLECFIRTMSGRRIRGKLLELRPGYRHGFGEIVQELLTARMELRQWFTGEFDTK